MATFHDDSHAAGAAAAVASWQRQQEEQNQLFRLLCHDLRNPIASAKMGADAILRSGDAPDKVRRKAQRASLALARADELISRFADLRALHAGAALPLRPEPGDLAAALPALQAQWSEEIRSRLTISVKAPAVGLWDITYMLRAVASLVDNAAKYGDREGPIEVTLQQEDEDLVLGVSNRGEALTEGERQRMLRVTPWQRVQSRQVERGGWGLGLLLVQSVATGHRGTLQVSQAGRQTRFSMHFASV